MSIVWIDYVTLLHGGEIFTRIKVLPQFGLERASPGFDGALSPRRNTLGFQFVQGRMRLLIRVVRFSIGATSAGGISTRREGSKYCPQQPLNKSETMDIHCCLLGTEDYFRSQTNTIPVADDKSSRIIWLNFEQFAP